MNIQHHALRPATPGTRQELVSLHYGTPGQGAKAVIQASLHADEAPGMLVAHHLRRRLTELEAAGQIAGEVVLVPAANPLGMHQWLLRGHQGRFDLASGQNFNRCYVDLADAVEQAVRGHLGPDATANVACVRAALRQAVAALPEASALDSLRKSLYALAIDADIVLDLHCDGEALLHFYTTPQCWSQAEPLARCLQAEVALLAECSGGEPFDEACSTVWTRLAERFGPQLPLPHACLAVTVELRGEADVDHARAAVDAEGIVRFLQHRGLVLAADAPPLPPLRCEPTPLAGSIPLIAPRGGVVVFLREPGARVVCGEPLVDLIDPIEGEVLTLTSPVDGLFFARENRRFAMAGMPLGKVAGREPRRSGSLLSA